ncbi:MAG TPA: glycosyltransferase family 9 protein [Candidatus Angelobacter sp.]|jgi:hypothetical protein|nr:glycosyltransferase family 9 protein [Candidatus Angelobacter sp.]
MRTYAASDSDLNSPLIQGIEHPVVIYNSGGIGDHLMSLPALRALAKLWPHRVTVVCVRGAGPLFFNDIALLRTEDTTTYYTHDGKTGKITLQVLPGAPTNGTGLPPASTQTPDAEWVRWTPWSFDPEAAAQKLGSCDAVFSLTPWHSPAIDRLCEILRPNLSIGFSSSFSIPLQQAPSRHLADVFFDVPQSLDSSLRIMDFVRGTFVPETYRMDALRTRKLVPDEFKVLVAHGETKPDKEWIAERFARTIDEFLGQHQDYVCFVLGKNSFHLEVKQHRTRVFHCYPLHLCTALALLEHADLFIGIDSCMLHSADLHGVPGVGLFGPSDAARTGFRFNHHKHVCGKDMTSISEQDVLGALNEIAVFSTRSR